MNDLQKISDITARYNLSARALRYYEDIGLIQSTRSADYAYRLYDEEAVKRIEQILILRKLNISIKDIGRIFNTPGSEIVLEVLGKKVSDIDDEIFLLQELKNVVMEFISQIEQADFGRESDVKLLYEKAKEIKTQLALPDYNGNPSAVNRLLNITEKLDYKIPDIMIVRIPAFRAMTSGSMNMEELFGPFDSWRAAHSHLFCPVLFDSPDFLYGKGGKAEWIWAVKDEVTETDTAPYEIFEYPGGLYAAAVSIDGDNESYSKVKKKIKKWLEGTNFVIDSSREIMVHMIYVDDEIKKGLGYDQQNLYAPIRLKEI